MGAEDRVRGVFQICLRVIAGSCDHRLAVVAGGIALETQLQSPPPLGVGCQYFGVILHLGGRHQPPQGGQPTGGLRRFKFAAHGTDVGNGSANQLRGSGDGKGIPGFQQYRFGLHQALPHRPIGGLPEVAALGVL